jgi:serine/threonine protein phosphatase PrpC
MFRWHGHWFQLGGVGHSNGTMTRPSILTTHYALTDRGRTRDHNEDTFLVADLDGGRALRDSRATERHVSPRGMLYLVADGMGGAAAGEIASEMAAVEIHRHIVERWSELSESSEVGFAEALRAAVEAANEHLHNHAIEHPEVRGMGTTATVAGVLEDRLYLAQIGDSRGYLIRGGSAIQLTRDQSLTQRLVEAGELTEEEAEASERRNIILQALGPDPRIKVDLSWQRLQRDDILILCSDGLSGVIRREDIADIVAKASTTQEICERLVERANEEGGPDNITVVAVRFEGEGLEDSVDELPGYHEFFTSEDERPSLRPTAAFPTPVPSGEYPPPVRRGSPTGLALTALGVAMAIVAVTLWLTLK